jgi:hypothetical protein
MLTIVLIDIDENDKERTTCYTNIKEYAVTDLNREVSVYETCYKTTLTREARNEIIKLTDVVSVAVFELGNLINTIKANLKH